MALHALVIISRVVFAALLLSISVVGVWAQALVSSAEALKEIKAHLDFINARRQEMDTRYGSDGLRSAFLTLLQGRMQKSGASYDGLVPHDTAWAGWLTGYYFETLKDVYSYHALALELSLRNIENSRGVERNKLQA
jgi:hypothetical protein